MHRVLAVRRRSRASPSPSRAQRRWLPLLDGAAAITLAGLAVASAALEPAQTALGVTKPFGAAAIGLILAMTLPLSGRRYAPRTIALFTTSAVTLAVLAGFPVGIGPFGAVFALHSLAYTTTHRTTVIVGAPCGLTLLFSLIWSPGDPNVGNVGNGLFILFALAAGALLRTHNEQRAALTQKNAELTAAREAHIRSAVNEERLRIAREVHDAVGHALVAITLQARVGKRRISRTPDRAHEALNEIESLSQHALDETRSAVASIRTEHQQSPPAPRITAASLQALIASMRGSDLDVELDLDLGDATVDADLERTAFRIIQESLSNVAKHAAPSHATVAVTADGTMLTVDVVNTGTTRTSPVAGSGIRGMRERAEDLGGTLVAGPTPTGWQVHARLPLQHDRPTVLA